jgi:hypothetical protein
MAKANAIEPFPRDVDRTAFANYLTGFVDGEGCFQLRVCRLHKPTGPARPTPSAVFSIGLRADDLPILQLIRSFLGCGRIVVGKSNDPRRQDSTRYQVSGTGNLLAYVIPHFDRFPLRAKKARDYLLWKEGVALLHQVSSLPRGANGPGTRGGSPVRWTPERMAQFYSLKTALKATRQFVPPVLPGSPARPSLFD